jgi:H+/Cl- antiporter ClcA
MAKSITWPIRGARAVAEWARNLNSDNEFWLRWVRGIAAVAVFSQPVAWVFFQLAMPERVTFIDKQLHKQPRGFVDSGLVSVGELFLVLGLFTSLIGLLLYWAIPSRQRTRVGWVLGFTTAASAIGLLISSLS